MTTEDSSVILRYPSLVQWFADCLAYAIPQLDGKFNELSSDNTKQTISVPRFSLDAKQFGILASPLPLKLAHQYQTQPATIGAVLIEHLQQQAQPAWLLPDLWIHPQGWLYAQFSALALSQWLQITLENPPPILESIPSDPTPGISTDPCWFQLQYVHARCCSLLRLAQTQQILPCTTLNLDNAKILFPQPIPWLTASHQWRLQDIAEQQVLTLLWQLPQLWTSQSLFQGHVSPHIGYETMLSWPLLDFLLRQQTAIWSDAFLHFYSECRLFTVDPTSDHLALSQARLSLVFLVRRITAFWLETLLQIEAPCSL